MCVCLIERKRRREWGRERGKALVCILKAGGLFQLPKTQRAAQHDHTRGALRKPISSQGKGKGKT